MNMRLTRRSVILASFLLLPGTIFAVQQGADTDASALARLEKFASDVRSAEGAFEQRTTDRDGNLVGSVSRGSFVFSRPGCFSWSYEDPYRQTIMSDGKTLWLYDEDLMQVSVRSLSGAIPATPASILFGEQNFGRDWHVSNLGAVDDGIGIRAVPVDRSAFEQVDLVFGEGPYPVQVILTDTFLNRTTIDFHNVQPSAATADQFVFKVPEGVDVLNENTFQ